MAGAVRKVPEASDLELNVMPCVLPALVAPEVADVVDDEALLVCAVAENAASDRDRARTMVFMMFLPGRPKPSGTLAQWLNPWKWPIPPIPWIDAVAPKVAAWNDPVAEAFVSVFSNVAPPLAMLSPTMIGALPLTWP